MDFINYGFNRRGTATGILLAITRAFDKLWHEELQIKMGMIGFPG
jgi:hypothetical protein